MLNKKQQQEKMVLNQSVSPLLHYINNGAMESSLKRALARAVERSHCDSAAQTLCTSEPEQQTKSATVSVFGKFNPLMRKALTP